MRAMRALVPLALATILLTCCGKDGARPEATPTPTDNGVSVLTADQILERATAALKAAKSFRMGGVFAGCCTWCSRQPLGRPVARRGDVPAQAVSTGGHRIERTYDRAPRSSAAVELRSMREPNRGTGRLNRRGVWACMRRSVVLGA
jgi:hypothetical protein